MSQDNGSATALPPTTAMTVNGRPIKFTPERLEQIRNLVERGKSREEIAEMIGVTLGSLQVTCSRMGISLRRPKPSLAIPMRRERQPAAVNHEKSARIEMDHPNGQLSQTGGQSHVRLSHGHRTIDLELPQDLLGRLAIEAHFEDLIFSELLSKLLTSALGNNGAA